MNGPWGKPPDPATVITAEGLDLFRQLKRRARRRHLLRQAGLITLFVGGAFMATFIALSVDWEKWPLFRSGPRIETTKFDGPFRNCREARAAGAAPIRRSQAGYAPHLDADGDGIACEWHWRGFW